MPVWAGLPSAEFVALTPRVFDIAVPLPHDPAEYRLEADALRFEFPQLAWQRPGKPDKICLGSRAQPEEWGQFRDVCPRTLFVAELLLRSLRFHNIEVMFGDVLDYNKGMQILGWHQDNMDLKRHTFTAVLTLSAEGDGRFEWRGIASDGKSLGDTVTSTRPKPGDLTIHGLTCNNSLAHRAFWETGRRVALVLFCRSPEVEDILRQNGIDSCMTMRHWWCKSFETTI